MYIREVREGDWLSVDFNFKRLGSIVFGPDASPTFTGLTLSGLTDNSLIYTTSGVLTSLGAATNGQIPIGSTGAVPVLAGITGTTNQVTVTNGAGSITLSLPQDYDTGASPTLADLTLSTPVNIYALSHDSFADFVANEHIDHSGVSITGGGILSGGGAITASQTITLAHSDVDHDQTTNFAANEHFLQTAITNVSTALATGLLKVTTTTGALSSITDNSTNWDTAYTHSQLTSGNPHSVTPAELSLVIGTDVQAYDAGLLSLAGLTYVSDSFIKMTGADTFALRTIAQTKSDLSLDAVENTALSSWAGSANITTVGTLTSGAIGAGFTSISTSYTDAKCTDATADNTAANETSHADVVVDGDFVSNGLMERTAAGTYGIKVIGTDVQAYHANLAAIAGGTWTGAASITTLGTIATGTWEATDVGIAYGGTGQSTAQAAIDALTNVSAATNEHVLTKDTTTGNAIFKAAAGGGSGYLGYIKLTETQTSGTNGGTFTQGAWQTRTLNTEDSDTNGDCSLSSNQITLAAGTYECHISAPAYFVVRHQARLYNVTDSALLLTGTSEYSDNTTGGQNTCRSFIVGRFTIAASKAIEVQHRCQTTFATYGFGVACSFGNEVYTVAEFWRVS